MPAIEEVRQAHAGVTSEWLVHDYLGDVELPKALERHGYEALVEHRAYVARPGLPIVAAEGLDIRRVDNLETFRDGETVFGRAFGAPHTVTGQHERKQLQQCASPNERTQRFVAYEHDAPVAFGAMTLFANQGFAMLWRGCTVPEARGRGIYKAVLKERMAFAERLGIRLVGLYAKLATSAPIVHHLGFEGHGRMTFWNRRPD